MKRSCYFLTILLIASACEVFFYTKETTHTITISNLSDSDLNLHWSRGSSEDTIHLEVNKESARRGSVKFLIQDGDRDQLEINDVYDQFEELILFAESSDGLLQEIDLELLEIEPFVTADGFMSTQQWYYAFQITNESLE